MYWIKFSFMRNFKLRMIFALYLFISSCAKDAEVQPKEYPYIITDSPIVTNTGVKFSADLTHLGDWDISGYGFVWSRNNNPTIADFCILFDDEKRKGPFSSFVNCGLAKGQTYYVRAFVLAGEVKVYGNVKSFNSLGSLSPIIKSFDPDYGPIGTKVIIEGDNFAFSKAANAVRLGDIEVIPDSVSKTRLVITIPQITKPEKVQIKVETEGMIALSRDSFDLWFPWKKHGNYDIDLTNAISFSYSSKGYVIQSNSNSLLEYNSNNNTFRIHSTIPENSSNMPLSSISESKVVVLLNTNIYELDLKSFEWTHIVRYPMTRSDSDYLFYLNNELYIGSFKKKFLYKYSKGENRWISMNAFNESTLYFHGYTNTEEYGYLFTGGNSIYRYSSLDNSWKLLNYFPYHSYDFCRFNICNYFFIGLGRGISIYKGYMEKEMWRFNIENNYWTKLNDCPKRMQAGLSLVIDEKAYVFSTLGEYYKILKEVWEFDPAKN